ncbi:hypothetical protein [Streptomyces sp. NPDC000880]
MTGGGGAGAATPLAQVPGQQFPPDVLARLEQIDRAATQHVEGNRPEKPRKSYTADWLSGSHRR